jgi:uncharacterized membrane-anchored protein
MKQWIIALAMCIGLAANAAAAQEAEPQAEQDNDKALQEFLAGLKYQTGDIRLPEAKTVIHANERYKLLGAKDAQSVLEDLWGNPPDSSVLGMIVPSAAGLMGDSSWAVVLTYSDDGYVSDEEAKTINYDELLSELKESTRADNAERKKAGYGTIELAGWATAPKFDAATSKMYWAKDLIFDGSAEHSLNYDVRVLGRHGYLSMNAVASMKDLRAIEVAMREVIPMAEFEPGARYADFNSSTDKTAAYGLAALLGAGAAGKLGFFGKLALVFAKFWKLLLIAVVLLGGTMKNLLVKLFSRKTKSAGHGSDFPPPPPR